MKSPPAISLRASPVPNSSPLRRSVFSGNRCPMILCSGSMPRTPHRFAASSRRDSPSPLPPRIVSTHLVFHGNRLVLVSKRNHKRLEIHEPPDSIHLSRYYQLFKDLLNREFNPIRSVRIEEINGRKAVDSPYGASLKAFGFSSDYKGFELRRSFSIL